MKVLVHNGKHGVDLYKASTSEEKFRSALKLLTTTHQHTGYYSDSVKEVNRIIEEQDGLAAWNFLMTRSRNGYEYESIEIQGVN